MRKLNPKIIREGDIVKIVNPVFVTRCGYPLGLEDMKNEVKERFGDDIDKLIHKVWTGEKEDSHPLNLKLQLSPNNRSKDKTYQKILNELAYVRLRAKDYGGKQRTLHTQVLEGLKDMEFQVWGTKICMTGEYAPGWHGSGFEDDYYEPACLLEAKAHKLLLLGPFNKEGKLSSDAESLKIEVTNVEKIPGMMETPIEYEYRMKQLEKKNEQLSMAR